MISVAVCVLLLTGGYWSGILASPTERIIGGAIAKAGDYPYQVSLRYLSQHFCGGSIIGQNWILTAAHCVHSSVGINIKTAKIVVGTTTLNSGGQTYSIYNDIYHEDFDPVLMEYDIALLQLKDSIKLSDTVKIIPFHSSTPSDGSNCQVSGWGYTSTETSPNELRHITLTIMDLGDCKDFFSLATFKVSSKNLCTAGYIGKGVCNGDSGGPLVSNGRQAGLVSWGVPCGRGAPDVFTNVAKFSSWITDKTGISVAATKYSSQTFIVSLLISLCVFLYN
ncbi:hypothetical protein FQR65_LT12985 [Abscondita terminalis]|nr:hypothetical protein FQR65_LT12985 [Abscondita terminalis]